MSTNKRGGRSEQQKRDDLKNEATLDRVGRARVAAIKDVLIKFFGDFYCLETIKEVCDQTSMMVKIGIDRKAHRKTDILIAWIVDYWPIIGSTFVNNSFNKYIELKKAQNEMLRAPVQETQAPVAVGTSESEFYDEASAVVDQHYDETAPIFDQHYDETSAVVDQHYDEASAVVDQRYDEDSAVVDQHCDEASALFNTVCSKTSEQKQKPQSS